MKDKPRYEVRIVQIDEDVVTEDDGFRSAGGEMAEAGRKPTSLTLHTPIPGVFVPVRTGDCCIVVIPEGWPSAGVTPVAWAGPPPPPQDENNLELHATRGGNLVLAPDRAAAGSEVRLGRDYADGDNAHYQALMLYPQASADLFSLKAKIDALALFVEGLTAQAGAAPIGVGAQAAVNLAGSTVKGGDQADSVVAASVAEGQG